LIRYNENSMAHSTSVVFICQKGELEIKSALLAASLRNILGNKIPLYCRIPQIPGLETLPGKDTIDFFESLKVQWQLFENPMMVNRIRPLNGLQFSNKLFCFPANLEEGRVVFLDSDMLCINKPKLFETFTSDFTACQAFKTLALNWSNLYAKTGITEPKLRVKSILDGKIGYPYFNSGHFSVNTHHIDNFLNVWRDLFLEIRGILENEKHLFHSDQIALSLAVQKLDLSYLVLSENYNFPSGSLLSGREIYFAHYHGPEKIHRDPILYRQTLNLSASYDEIRNIAARYKYWKSMISGSNASTSTYFIYKLKKALRNRHGKFI
jgi:hypothetical protein